MNSKILKNLKQKKRSAFTLIELVVVIAIIGILITLVAPKFSGFIRRAKQVRADAAAKTLYTAAQVQNAITPLLPESIEQQDVQVLYMSQDELDTFLVKSELEKLKNTNREQNRQEKCFQVFVYKNIVVNAKVLVDDDIEGEYPGDFTLPEEKPEPNYYIVRFFDKDGVMIGSAQRIAPGGNASMLEDTEAPENKVFVSWDKTEADLTNIQQNIDVYPIFEDIIETTIISGPSFQGIFTNYLTPSNSSASNANYPRYEVRKYENNVFSDIDLTTLTEANYSSYGMFRRISISGNPLVLLFFDDENKICYWWSQADVIYFNANCEGMFCNSYLTSIDSFLLNWDSSKIVNARRMFANCDCYLSPTGLNLSKFNTSNIENMSEMFIYDNTLTSLDLSKFDTSKVTDMNNMFFYCQKLTTLDLRSFDTKNVKDMSRMFASNGGGMKLKSISFGEKWDTSNVENMSYMFGRCGFIEELNLSGFHTQKCKNMSGMFTFEDFNNNCSIKSLDVSGFDTSNVEDMSRMFADCTTISSLDLSNFDTSNVTNMGGMFSECYSLTDLNLSNFNTKNVTRMDRMFFGCTSLENINLSSFNTSNVSTISEMFYDTKKLKTIDLSSFDTSSVSDCFDIFKARSDFGFFYIDKTIYVDSSKWTLTPEQLNATLDDYGSTMHLDGLTIIEK